MKNWKSCAKWDPCHGFYNDMTTDKHDTKEQAEEVLKLLRREGLGGERCHFPLETWVEPITKKGVKMAKNKITMLCFHINMGDVQGGIADGNGTWSMPIDFSKKFKIKSKDLLSIIQEFEEKHGFELVCHWPTQFHPGVSGDQFIMRKRSKA
ncbi:MAG: hypothetical protein PVG39_00625 [Desulfobacteraceae bacterium]|jgi:hypothetical protein